MAKTLQEQTKTHADQMTALNKTLEDFKKASAESSAKQGEALAGLQKSNADLMKKNADTNRALADAQAKLAQAQNSSGHSGVYIAVAVIAVIIMIISLLAR